MDGGLYHVPERVVEVADGRIFVRDPAPLGDPNLDAALIWMALTGLAGSRGVPVGEWMQDIPAGFVTAYFDRLEAAGVLRSETVWLLFIAKRRGYRLMDPSYFENLRAALAIAVTRAGPAEPGLAARIGQSARRLAVDRYGWSEAALALEGFYRWILENPS